MQQHIDLAVALQVICINAVSEVEVMMEPIIVIVGFLGVGKTTLLKKIIHEFLEAGWNPFMVLNDYENAYLDAQDFLKFLKPEQMNALSGSCICCSGINELRAQVNNIPLREKGITLIEANGTTDAVSLMGFLGVGMNEHFLPPVQLGVVDVRLWQKRGFDNDLEASQIQVASVIILNFVDQVDRERVVEVEQDLRNLNRRATILHWDQLDITSFPELTPNKREADKLDHSKAHWASCSVTLPDPMELEHLKKVVEEIPAEILRLKGCTRLQGEENYTFFERTPSGDVFMRPYNGKPAMGSKLLTIGPGSDPDQLQKIILKCSP